MKKFSILGLMLLIYLCAYAQQTSLTIDNQTPGWLSSKINYGDQLTVQNLTVTGYLNTTDLEFIGLLMGKSLNGHINLENTFIVEDSENEENIFPTSAFKLSEGYNIRKLSLPSTLTGMGDWNKVTVSNNEQSLTLDTLIIGGEKLKHLTSDNICNCSILIIREGVDSLGNFTDDIESLEQIIASNFTSNLKNVMLPNGIKFIGNGFFRDCTELTTMNLPESLEEIHSGAFKGTKFLPSILCLPSNLKKIHIGAFYNTNVTELICPKTLQEISGLCINSSSEKVPVYDMLIIHLKGNVPNILRKPSTSGLKPRPWPTFVTENWIVYTSSEYINSYMQSSIFNKGTVLPEIEIGNINFEIPIGKNDGEVLWVSDNPQIAEVTASGEIIAKGVGICNVICSSIDGGFKDSCNVQVIQPVTGITLDKQIVELTFIGESVQLQATVLPEDAENKNVKWSSSNEKICIVSSNGTIVGLSDGVAIIIATTEEGAFLATCQVTVNTASGIDSTTDNPIQISVDGNSVYIANKSPNDIVVIYSTVGEIIYKGYDDRVVLPNGICIVKVGNLYHKIVL